MHRADFGHEATVKQVFQLKADNRTKHGKNCVFHPRILVGG